MSNIQLIWPSYLHHLCLATEDPLTMKKWYQQVMGMSPQTLSDNLIWLSGPHRNILLTDGPPGKMKFAGFSVKNHKHLESLKTHLVNKNVNLTDIKSPLFQDDCFGFVDPDGNQFILGVPISFDGGDEKLPGCLQHVVFATNQLETNLKFYTEILGFRISDIVHEKDTGNYTACFLRSDKMHHSLAFFRAPEAKLDHFANETNCWNDIRDWGDHFATNDVKIVWGAGRHGAGNNLFIFVRDPDHNNVEISAELEMFTYEQKPRFWSHDHRPLNLWGEAWLRS